MSITEYAAEQAREKEVEAIVQRRYELAMEELFGDMDDLVRKGELTEEEALSGLSHIDDDLADEYEAWAKEGLA